MFDGFAPHAGYAKTSKHGQVRFVISLPGNTGRLRCGQLRAIERGLQAGETA